MSAEIATTLGSARSRENGFDTIRLLAAVAVLVSHSFALTGFTEPLEGANRGVTLGVMAVGVFFVISGYLITGTAEASSTTQFIARRSRRIMPALIVCVFVCVAMGLIVTELPPEDYLGSPTTWLFLANAVFIPLSQYLPGVFSDNLANATNGSLWTLKYEVACYGVSLAFARWRWHPDAVLWIGWLASLALSRWFTGEETGALYYLERFAFLFRFYGAGMLIYRYRNRVPLRADFAAVAFLAVCMSPALGVFPEAAASLGGYALLVFAYRSSVWFRDLTKRGDISYGVYLYAFPIQQLLVPLSLETATPWLTNIALSLPLALIAGAASWLLIERHFVPKRAAKPTEIAADHAF